MWSRAHPFEERFIQTLVLCGTVCMLCFRILHQTLVENFKHQIVNHMSRLLLWYHFLKVYFFVKLNSISDQRATFISLKSFYKNSWNKFKSKAPFENRHFLMCVVWACARRQNQLINQGQPGDISIKLSLLLPPWWCECIKREWFPSFEIQSFSLDSMISRN